MKRCQRYTDLKDSKRTALIPTKDNISLQYDNIQGYHQAKRDLAKPGADMFMDDADFEQIQSIVEKFETTIAAVATTLSKPEEVPQTTVTATVADKYFMSRTMFQQFIERDFDCKLCGCGVSVNKSNAVGHNLTVGIQCNNCRNQIKFTSAEPGINRQAVQSGLLSAIDFAEYSRFNSLMDMNSLEDSILQVF